MEARAATAARQLRASKRAAGLLRGAARLLAEATGDVDLVAELVVTREQGTAAALELLELELSRRPELELVLLARPR